MSQRTGGTRGKGSGSGGSGRGSRRVSSAPVKKPFPWGFVAGVGVLVLLLGGILFYAATNTGSGFKTAADKLDARIDGVKVTKNPSFNHVSVRVAYPDEAQRPPDSGNHNPLPQTCAVYDAPVVPEHAVHSLEHGAVWITYRPGLPDDQLQALKSLVESDPSYRMLSPYPGLEAPVTLQAWGRRLEVQSATDPRVQEFVDGYTDGPQTREKGTACSGADQPGTVPFVQQSDGTIVPGPTDLPTAPASGTVPSGEPGSAAPGGSAGPGGSGSSSPDAGTGGGGGVPSPGVAPSS